jgi:glyoxylase-like metal-dependent hydrolase (beta-lactamase superfamily II)
MLAVKNVRLAMKKAVLLALAFLSFPIATWAQMPGAGPGAAGPMRLPPSGPITLHQLGRDVYWGEGGIGNVGVILGDKGVILVDSTISPEAAGKLLAEVAKITPKPVTTVIITHGDIDHVGGLKGLPPGITVIAQRWTADRIAAGIASGRSPVDSVHVPGQTIEKSASLVLDGRRIELRHWAPAHTSGDLVVYLPDAKIVFTGDIFALDQPRALIHLEQQGSSAGWVESAHGILALDADRYVVGHGGVQTKAALAARTAQSEAERAEVIRLAKSGIPLVQIEKLVGDEPVLADPARPGPHFAPFADVVYAEVHGNGATEPRR